MRNKALHGVRSWVVEFKKNSGVLNLLCPKVTVKQLRLERMKETHTQSVREVKRSSFGFGRIEKGPRRDRKREQEDRSEERRVGKQIRRSGAQEHPE